MCDDDDDDETCYKCCILSGIQFRHIVLPTVSFVLLAKIALNMANWSNEPTFELGGNFDRQIGNVSGRVFLLC